MNTQHNAHKQTILVFFQWQWTANKWIFWFASMFNWTATSNCSETSHSRKWGERWKKKRRKRNSNSIKRHACLNLFLRFLSGCILIWDACWRPDGNLNCGIFWLAPGGCHRSTTSPRTASGQSCDRSPSKITVPYYISRYWFKLTLILLASCR